MNPGESIDARGMAIAEQQPHRVIAGGLDLLDGHVALAGLGLALGGGMALHFRAGTLDPQIFGAELMARPIIEGHGEQTTSVREAQFRGPGGCGG